MKHEQIALIGPILTKKIETSIPQVAVDGGIAFSTNPILWVGDGDSASSPSSNIKMQPKQTQDETDLRFCLKQIQGWEWKQLHLYGFLGKRKDHEWANLGEVCQELAERGEDSFAVFYEENSKTKVYIFSSGTHYIQINGLFSVLTFEKTVISISGSCEFQIKNEILMPLSGRGISNQGAGEVLFQANAPVMVIVGNE